MRYYILFIVTISFCFASCGSSGSEGGAPSAKNDIHRKLADVVPKAKMRDAGIENQLVEYFNSVGWDEKFKAAIIVSDEFNYKKSFTGTITDRKLNVLMVSVRPNGTCMYQDFTVISPKIEDNKYGKFKRYSTGDQEDIPCDGLK